MKHNVRKMIWFLALVGWLLLNLFPRPALAAFQPAAASAPASSALQDFMNQVLAVLVPIVVSVIGLLGGWVLVKLKNKFHIDGVDQQLETWSKLASSAALRAAEWIRQNTAADQTPDGAAALQVAVNWATQMADHQGLQTMAREKLTGLIESELFKLRLATQAPPIPGTRPDNAKV